MGILIPSSIDLKTFACGILTLLITMLYLASRKKKQPKGPLPPGPSGWPWVGVIPDIVAAGGLAKKFCEWAEQYGDWTYFELGSRPVLVLSSIEAVRETWVRRGDVLSARPATFLTDVIMKQRGISASNGRTWREQRRFALSTLRDFGMGKVRLEESILNEANALVKVIEAKNGQPFDVHQTIMTSVCNVIYSMVFGKRYDHNDNELDGFTKRIDENLRNFDRIQATVSILPWLRFLPGDMFKYWKALDNLAYVDDGMMEEIDQHKKSHKPEITRDFIDAYINRMKECSHEEDSTFDDLQLLKVCEDLFVAGSETTTTALRWSLVYMMRNPDVQDKLYELIEEKVGDSDPSTSHRKNLVLVEATLNEILRCSTFLETGVPHETTEEVSVNGYRIPVGTMVFANVLKIHYDPRHWKNPEKFNPHRFIDEEGKLIIPDSFIPFSVGKRACIGESLAKMELFLIFTFLIKHFKFIAEDPVQIRNLKGVGGFVSAPEPHKIKALRR